MQVCYLEVGGRGAYGRGQKLGQQNSRQQRLLWPRRVEDVVVDGPQGRQESHRDGDGAPAPGNKISSNWNHLLESFLSNPSTQMLPPIWFCCTKQSIFVLNVVIIPRKYLDHYNGVNFSHQSSLSESRNFPRKVEVGTISVSPSVVHMVLALWLMESQLT